MNFLLFYIIKNKYQKSLKITTISCYQTFDIKEASIFLTEHQEDSKMFQSIRNCSPNFFEVGNGMCST